MRKGLLYLLFLLLCSTSYSQNDTLVMAAPFDFPLLLSGNFGELRTNHFHAGVDFKTEGVVGKTILAPADGYICRATVSPGGYGKAIYVMHNNGYMTVYGHLHRFSPEVGKRVRSRQYSDEMFSVDLRFNAGEFPVRQGEPIAMAGNSGYSFGPHLHFEVRSSDGERLINPMRFYHHKLKDNRPPVIYSVAVTPYYGKGVVNNGTRGVIKKVSASSMPDTIKAWGTIGVSVRANDFMDETNNRYGLYSMQLYVDDSLRFSSKMDDYAIKDTRLINGWIDYAMAIESDIWYQHLYRLGNNRLDFITTDNNDGWIVVNEERDYNVECRLADYHGNIKSHRIIIKGVSDSIPSLPDDGSHYLYWFLNNEITYNGMRLSIPQGQLMDNSFVRITEKQSRFELSHCYSLGDTPLPLRSKARLSMQLNDTALYAPEKYHIRRITKKGTVNVGGEYKDGWVTTDITMLGCYEVAVDTMPPKVKVINGKKLGRNGKLQFKIGDKGRGVKEFKGTVDGEFILFEYSSKNGTLTCNLKNEGVRRGKHRVRLTVIDNAGNATVVDRNFIY